MHAFPPASLEAGTVSYSNSNSLPTERAARWLLRSDWLLRQLPLTAYLYICVHQGVIISFISAVACWHVALNAASLMTHAHIIVPQYSPPTVEDKRFPNFQNASHPHSCMLWPDWDNILYLSLLCNSHSLVVLKSTSTRSTFVCCIIILTNYSSWPEVPMAGPCSLPMAELVAWVSVAMKQYAFNCFLTYKLK